MDLQFQNDILKAITLLSQQIQVTGDKRKVIQKSEDFDKTDAIADVYLKTFNSRKACMEFIESYFGFDQRKNIVCDDSKYRSSNNIFMRCDNCELFRIVARKQDRSSSGYFQFDRELCVLTHGNKNKLPCSSIFKASKVLNNNLNVIKLLYLKCF